MDYVQSKVCTRCKKEKPFSEFNKNGKRGLYPSCKVCKEDRMRTLGSRERWYRANAEYVKEKAKAWRESERGKALIRAKNRRQDVRDKKRERSRIGRAMGLSWAANGRGNIPQHDAHVRAWKAWKTLAAKASKVVLHCAHVSAWRKARASDAYRHRYRTDPEFCAKEKMRARLRTVGVDNLGLHKNAAFYAKRGKWRETWAQILGYTQEQLIEHLRRTVPRGWRFEHFLSGELEIDHIKPRSMFDMRMQEEVIACWSLENMRLLPASENRRKGANDGATWS